VRILWLYGPPAVGKSVVAWELLNLVSELQPSTGYVDIDQLAMTYYAHDDIDPERHHLKARALAAIANEFERSGARALVVSGVVDPEFPSFYATELARFRPALLRLTAPDEVLQRRLESRGARAAQWADVAAYARRLDAAKSEHPVIDTGATTPAEAAELCSSLMATLLDEEPQEPLAVPGSDESGEGGGGQVLLIGGTTAVGKSTIGVRAWRTSQADGGRSAFVDLRQLGFLGPGGGPVDHDLQARSCAALWRVLRANGARLLIANGPVNRAADLKPYLAAFVATRLQAVRLTADRFALTERVHARFRGEMAALAGDLLVGRPAAHADEVVDSALRAQAEADADGSIPALDTSGLDAAEAARRVLLALPTGPDR
jgi:hypothetical protein